MEIKLSIMYVISNLHLVLTYESLWVKCLKTNLICCSKITAKRASSNLKYTVSSLLEAQASDIHEPYFDVPRGLPGSKGIMDPPVRRVRSGWSAGGGPNCHAIGCLVYLQQSFICLKKKKNYFHLWPNANIEERILF